MHAQGVGVPRKIEGGVERRVSGDKIVLRTTRPRVFVLS